MTKDNCFTEDLELGLSPPFSCENQNKKKISNNAINPFISIEWFMVYKTDFDFVLIAFMNKSIHICCHRWFFVGETNCPKKKFYQIQINMFHQIQTNKVLFNFESRAHAPDIIIFFFHILPNLIDIFGNWGETK